MISPTDAKSSIRVLKFLQGNKNVSASAFDDGARDSVMLRAPSNKRMLVQSLVLDGLHRAALIDRQGDYCVLSDLGHQKLKRLASAEDGFSDQHRDIAKRNIQIDGERQTVSVNLNESPLERLRRRKDPQGNSWLNDEQVEAGERLRRDFTSGQMMQKVTSSWSSTIGNKGAGQGGKADLADSAIDARSRLQRATDVLGPDLAGVITDVCCFLKGLETVERERRWPPRSAKLMLRTGLELLSRHYGTKAGRHPLST